jgi:hypothetical protein
VSEWRVRFESSSEPQKVRGAPGPSGRSSLRGCDGRSMLGEQDAGLTEVNVRQLLHAVFQRARETRSAAADGGAAAANERAGGAAPAEEEREEEHGAKRARPVEEGGEAPVEEGRDAKRARLAEEEHGAKRARPVEEGGAAGAKCLPH